MSKLTANQREFEKQIRRINRLINKVEAEGLVFIKPPIEPVTPKRVTRSRLEKLQSISLPSLRVKSYKIDETTGEVISYKKPVCVTHTKTPTTGFRSYGADVKLPLSKERLHQIRQEAGRKAQETIKRRMSKDPFYAKRITEARKRASQKAHETLRKRMEKEPAFAKKMRDIWSKNLAKGRAKGMSVEPTDIIPPTVLQPSPEEIKIKEIEEMESSPDYQPANATDETLNNVIEILNGAVNKHVADVLIRVINDQMEEEGREALAKRLSTGKGGYNDSYWLLDLATKVAFYDSDRQEEIKQSAYTLAYIITNGSVGQFTQDEIISAVSMDFGGYYQ